MIHVAPCSCELHVRIRELETELAETKRRWAAEPEERKRWQTEQIRLAYEQRLEAVARAEKAEARVAELERAAREHICMTEERPPRRPFVEAREREEC